MKHLSAFIFAAMLLFASTPIASARAVRHWSYQERLDKSDLVVIATPITTNDTQEYATVAKINGSPPEIKEDPIIGVETTFKISTVLKGDKALTDFVLHHYRFAPNSIMPVNPPEFISFDPTKQQECLLFLVREADGRYASVVGQMDPGLAIQDLGWHIK